MENDYLTSTVQVRVGSLVEFVIDEPDSNRFHVIPGVVTEIVSNKELKIMNLPTGSQINVPVSSCIRA